MTKEKSYTTILLVLWKYIITTMALFFFWIFIVIDSLLLDRTIDRNKKKVH